MHAIWLGAGYSHSVAGLPLAAKLFDFKIKARVREASRIEHVEIEKAAWDRANPEGLAEQFIAEAMDRGGDIATDVLWYIARRLTEPFVRDNGWRRATPSIDDLPSVPGAGFLRTTTGGGCAGIVTTNYDLLVEYSLGSRGFNYGVCGERLAGSAQFGMRSWSAPQVVLGGVTRLAKIHGSVSWDAESRYLDARRGVSGDALIMAPTPGKRPPAALSGVWDLAAQILARSERLVVYGFGFNPYDENVLELMATAGRDLRHILLIDPQPKVAPAAGIWPRADIDTVDPLPSGGAAICDWLGLADWCRVPDFVRG